VESIPAVSAVACGLTASNEHRDVVGRPAPRAKPDSSLPGMRSPSSALWTLGTGTVPSPTLTTTSPSTVTLPRPSLSQFPSSCSRCVTVVGLALRGRGRCLGSCRLTGPGGLAPCSQLRGTGCLSGVPCRLLVWGKVWGAQHAFPPLPSVRNHQQQERDLPQAALPKDPACHVYTPVPPCADLRSGPARGIYGATFDEKSHYGRYGPHHGAPPPHPLVGPELMITMHGRITLDSTPLGAVVGPELLSQHHGGVTLPAGAHGWAAAPEGAEPAAPLAAFARSQVRARLSLAPPCTLLYRWLTVCVCVCVCFVAQVATQGPHGHRHEAYGGYHAYG